MAKTPNIRDLKNNKGFVNNQIPTESSSDQKRQAAQNTHVTEAPDPSMTEVPKSAETPEKDVIKAYLDFLEEHDVHKEEIFAVLDSIISSGEVFWSFELFDKIEVIFRMRPAWVNDILVQELEKRNPRMYAHFTGVVGEHNLAGSLYSYNGKVFPLVDEEQFAQTLKYVRNLPFAVQNPLVKKLAIFDRVIAVATSDWALKNFTKPQSDE